MRRRLAACIYDVAILEQWEKVPQRQLYELVLGFVTDFQAAAHQIYNPSKVKHGLPETSRPSEEDSSEGEPQENQVYMIHAKLLKTSSRELEDDMQLQIATIESRIDQLMRDTYWPIFGPFKETEEATLGTALDDTLIETARIRYWKISSIVHCREYNSL